MSTLCALFNLGRGEIMLILALAFILFGARKLPEMAKGLGEGLTKARRDAADELEPSRRHWKPSAKHLHTFGFVLWVLLGLTILAIWAAGRGLL